MRGDARLHGVGVDLVRIARFERFARKHAARLPELFAPAELRRGPAHLPVAFAVKEAALKAIGGLTGWDLDWREIAAPSGASGGVVLRGAVRAHAARLGVGRVEASTARFRGYALVTVIALRGGSPRR